MADTPGALQLRLLETIVEVAAEKNSTLVLPFPVELLRFLEHNSAPPKAASAPVPSTNTETAASTGPAAITDQPTSAPASLPVQITNLLTNGARTGGGTR